MRPTQMRYYTIYGDIETLDRFEKFISRVGLCSSIGRSCSFLFEIDGDDRFNVKLNELKKPEIIVIRNPHYAEQAL